MRDAAAGFTLIEVLVSLALFAIIGGAGIAILDQVLRTQARTDVRLDGLAAMQRAVLLITHDVSQSDDVRSGDTVQVRRGAQTVVYALQDSQLVRSFADVQQPILAGVSGLEWVFLDDQNAWVDTWPASEDAQPPRAVAVTLDLGTRGQIRRVVGLPAAME